MAPAGEERHRAVAARIDREFPAWMVIWGGYSRQFVAFPLFRAAPGVVVASYDPHALTARMREMEHPGMFG